MAFEFRNSTAETLVMEVVKNCAQIKMEQESYKQQASTNLQAATQYESEASSALAGIDYKKTITVEDDDGSKHHEEVVDEAANSAACALAASLKAMAQNLRGIAQTLLGLVALLGSASQALQVQEKQFKQAIDNTNMAIAITGTLLSAGLDLMADVVSAFDVPKTDNKKEWAKNVGNNLLKIVGVDLSDGLNDEIYTAIGITTQLGVIVGTIALKSTSAMISTKLGPGIVGTAGKQVLNVGTTIITNKYLNQTGAKRAQNAIASALTLHGINALPTVKKQAGEEQATLDSEVKNDVNATSNGKNEKENATLGDNVKSSAKGSSSGTAGKNNVKVGTTTNTEGKKGASTDSNGKTDAELEDKARQQFEDVNESWKKKEEAEKTRLSQANSDIKKYDKFIKDGDIEIEQINQKIAKNNETYDSKHEEFGKQGMQIDYDQLRKDMENIKKENERLEKRIERINTNKETWQNNKEQAENIKKSIEKEERYKLG